MFGTDRHSPQGLVTLRLREEPTAHGGTSARQLWQLFCAVHKGKGVCALALREAASLVQTSRARSPEPRRSVQMPPRVNSPNHHGTLGGESRDACQTPQDT